MINRLDAGKTDPEQIRNRLLKRAGALDENLSKDRQERLNEIFGKQLTAGDAVREIIASVKTRGDEAVFEWTRKIDGIDLEKEGVKVSEEEIEKALEELDPALRRCLETAQKNIETYQREILLPVGASLKGELGIMYTPLDRAGVYVPGGLAAYPSSVLMNVVPAQVAGVKEIAVMTPPGKKGVNPTVLAALGLVGVTEVYRVGGAQAIAAFAFGTQSIRRADIIAGPGNIFVSLAKKEVFGACSIDMFAGPSEILVICDETTSARHAAADMLSQAEHDPMASAIAVSTSSDFADALCDELEIQLERLPKKGIAAASLAEYGFVVTAESIEQAAEISNMIAPEHLEVLAADPESVLKLLRHAGAIFLGPNSPEPVGDYTAGPSHTLPTSGTARFSSGLTANTFLKSTSLIRLSRETFLSQAHTAARLARSESLEAHARSVESRKS